MRHDPLRPVVPALDHWLCALRLDRGRVPDISRQVWLRNQGEDQIRKSLLDGPERSEGRSSSDRLRRRRAGGNPLHLQEGRSCCSVNLRVGCATAGGVRQGFAEKNRSCSPSVVVKVSQSRGPEPENQDTVSGQLSEVSGG